MIVSYLAHRTVILSVSVFYQVNKEVLNNMAEYSNRLAPNHYLRMPGINIKSFFLFLELCFSYQTVFMLGLASVLYLFLTIFKGKRQILFFCDRQTDR